MRGSALGLLLSLAPFCAPTAFASDRCTILYELDVAFHVSDTDFGKGDAVVPVPGSLLLEVPLGSAGEVQDGKVKVLHFAMVERFTLDSLVTVTTTVHHFTPTCNGERNPSWRSPKDPGFPERCRYGGTRRAVAVGSLDRDGGTIHWDKCKAAATYWSKDRRAYTTEQKSRGKGCLDPMRGVGNVHCEGRLGCRLGWLSRGDNPIDLEWTQPLLPGPPGTPGRLLISSDLKTIRSPEPASGGFASYNLPNDSPSRLWFSFEGTRSSASKLTTCPSP